MPCPQQNERDTRSYVIPVTDIGWLINHKWNGTGSCCIRANKNPSLTFWVIICFPSVTKPVPLTYHSLRTTPSRWFFFFLCRISQVCQLLPSKWLANFDLTWLMFFFGEIWKINIYSILNFRKYCYGAQMLCKMSPMLKVRIITCVSHLCKKYTAPYPMKYILKFHI